MAWAADGKKPKWNWRKELTPDEAAFIREADAEAKIVAEKQSRWQKKYSLRRMKIVNRAIQRAKYGCRP